MPPILGFTSPSIGPLLAPLILLTAGPVWAETAQAAADRLKQATAGNVIVRYAGATGVARCGGVRVPVTAMPRYC